MCAFHKGEWLKESELPLRCVPCAPSTRGVAQAVGSSTQAMTVVWFVFVDGPVVVVFVGGWPCSRCFVTFTHGVGRGHTPDTRDILSTARTAHTKREVKKKLFLRQNNAWQRVVRRHGTECERDGHGKQARMPHYPPMGGADTRALFLYRIWPIFYFIVFLLW